MSFNSSLSGYDLINSFYTNEINAYGLSNIGANSNPFNYVHVNNISSQNFYISNITSTNLQIQNITSTSLISTNLSVNQVSIQNLRSTRITCANIVNTNLTNTNISTVNINFTSFTNAIISTSISNLTSEISNTNTSINNLINNFNSSISNTNTSISNLINNFNSSIGNTNTSISNLINNFNNSIGNANTSISNLINNFNNSIANTNTSISNLITNFNNSIGSLKTNFSSNNISTNNLSFDNIISPIYKTNGNYGVKVDGTTIKISPDDNYLRIGDTSEFNKGMYGITIFNASEIVDLILSIPALSSFLGISSVNDLADYLDIPQAYIGDISFYSLKTNTNHFRYRYTETVLGVPVYQVPPWKLEIKFPTTEEDVILFYDVSADTLDGDDGYCYYDKTNHKIHFWNSEQESSVITRMTCGNYYQPNKNFQVCGGNISDFTADYINSTSNTFSNIKNTHTYNLKSGYIESIISCSEGSFSNLTINNLITTNTINSITISCGNIFTDNTMSSNFITCSSLFTKNTLNSNTISVGNLYCNNTINSGCISVSNIFTKNTINSNTISVGNLFVNNTINSAVISIGTLYVQNTINSAIISVGSVYVKNSTSSLMMSSSNLYFGKATGANLVSTYLSCSSVADIQVINAGNITCNNVVSTNGTSTNLKTTYLSVGSVLSSEIIAAGNITSQNLVSSNLSTTNLKSSNIDTANISITNLSLTNLPSSWAGNKITVAAGKINVDSAWTTDKDAKDTSHDASITTINGSIAIIQTEITALAIGEIALAALTLGAYGYTYSSNEAQRVSNSNLIDSIGCIYDALNYYNIYAKPNYDTNGSTITSYSGGYLSVENQAEFIYGYSNTQGKGEIIFSNLDFANAIIDNTGGNSLPTADTRDTHPLRIAGGLEIGVLTEFDTNGNFYLSEKSGKTNGSLFVSGVIRQGGKGNAIAQMNPIDEFPNYFSENIETPNIFIQGTASNTLTDTYDLIIQNTGTIGTCWADEINLNYLSASRSTTFSVSNTMWSTVGSLTCLTTANFNDIVITGNLSANNLILTSLTSTSLLSTNLSVNQVSIQNLRATRITSANIVNTNLTNTNISTVNINFTNFTNSVISTSLSNLSTDISNIQTSIGNINTNLNSVQIQVNNNQTSLSNSITSIGNLISNFNNSIGNLYSAFTSTNIVLSNLSANNLSITNTTFTNSIITNITNSQINNNQVSLSNAITSIGNLISNFNNSIGNLQVSIASLASNLSITNTTFTNSLITNLTAVNLTYSTSTINTQVINNISATNSTLTNSIITSITNAQINNNQTSLSNCILSVGNLISNYNNSIGNLQVSIASLASNFSSTNTTLTNVIITNITNAQINNNQTSLSNCILSVGNLISNFNNSIGNLLTNISSTNISTATLKIGSFLNTTPTSQNSLTSSSLIILRTCANSSTDFSAHINLVDTLYNVGPTLGNIGSGSSLIFSGLYSNDFNPPAPKQVYRAGSRIRGNLEVNNTGGSMYFDSCNTAGNLINAMTIDYKQQVSAGNIISNISTIGSLIGNSLSMSSLQSNSATIQNIWIGRSTGSTNSYNSVLSSLNIISGTVANSLSNHSGTLLLLDSQPAGSGGGSGPSLVFAGSPVNFGTPYHQASSRIRGINNTGSYGGYLYFDTINAGSGNLVNALSIDPSQNVNVVNTLSASTISSGNLNSSTSTISNILNTNISTTTLSAVNINNTNTTNTNLLLANITCDNYIRFEGALSCYLVNPLVYSKSQFYANVTNTTINNMSNQRFLYRTATGTFTDTLPATSTYINNLNYRITMGSFDKMEIFYYNSTGNLWTVNRFDESTVFMRGGNTFSNVTIANQQILKTEVFKMPNTNIFILF